MSVLFVFSSCASPAKEKRLTSGGPSAGARIGKGAVNGLRYLVGAPFFVGMAVLGPLGGAPPSAGLEMLQKLHDYELPDGPPKPESGFPSRSQTPFGNAPVRATPLPPVSAPVRNERPATETEFRPQRHSQTE